MASDSVGDRDPKSHFRSCLLGPLLVPTVTGWVLGNADYERESGTQEVYGKCSRGHHCRAVKEAGLGDCEAPQ